MIPGLYAIGEVIGSAAVNGNAFCSGMCLTPAMAFGRLVARQPRRGGSDGEYVNAKPSARSFAEDTGTTGVLISAR